MRTLSAKLLIHVEYKGVMGFYIERERANFHWFTAYIISYCHQMNALYLTENDSKNFSRFFIALRLLIRFS